MRFFCSDYVLFLSLFCLSFFFLPSIEAQTNDTSATEFVPTPQRKKNAIEERSADVVKQTAQPKQIMGMQGELNIDEISPIPKRKKSVDPNLEDALKLREAENKIKSEKSFGSKKNGLVVAEIIDSIREKLTKCWSIPESIAYKENFSIKKSIYYYPIKVK